MKSQFFDEPLPFSDYFILELVNILGVEWLDFYYVVFYLLLSFALGGWVVAFYIKYKWDKEIIERGTKTMKKAFTMIELVFVIVVIGILAAVMIPRIDSSTLSERAIELVSKIRYTQHLAMVDDKFDASNSNWMRNRWQIVFDDNKYSIVSNGTYAVNTMNNGNPIQDIELRGVTVELEDGCDDVEEISFDSLGRPMIGDITADTTAYTAAHLLTSTCVITLDDGTDSLDINIIPETGYASIIYP